MIKKFWQDLSGDNAAHLEDVVWAYVHEDVDWHGSHPINDIRGTAALITDFYRPLLRAFPNLRRTPYVFVDGRFADKDWVSSTGYFDGTFANDWLGIPATGQPAQIRFGEFCAIHEHKISEVYLILDMVELMIDCGYAVLPPSRGDEDPRPPTSRSDDMLHEAQNIATSARSLALVEDMIFNGLSKFDGKEQRTLKLTDFWSEHMHWYGPGGIGSAFNLSEYYDVHSKPFLSAFPDRKGGNHKARIAQGNFVASTGWPSVRTTHSGEYLGCPATHKPISMRVMDWWRCDFSQKESGTLLQNWVFIDVPNLFLQFGVDLFDRLRDQ